MKKLIRETAEEILQEYTNCYNEADEDCLVKMLEKLASNMAMEIFEEIEKTLLDDENDFAELSEQGLHEGYLYCENYLHGLRGHIADLKKKYESEGADDENCV
jgi:hypothetical protein